MQARIGALQNRLEYAISLADSQEVNINAARNFNAVIAASAARVTIAEVEELVEVGQLEPDQVHTPSIYVQRLIQGEHYEKWIEQRTTRPRPTT